RQASDCGQSKLCNNGSCAAQPGCSRSADCTDPRLPVCDGSQHACVQCLQSTDCKDLSKPVCDASHHCVAPVVCHANSDCVKPTPVCNAANGNCVQCLADGDYPSDLACSPQKTCVLLQQGCNSDGDCPAGEYCRSSDKTCQVKQCMGDADCSTTPGTPHCDTSPMPHVCVACLANSDCPN